MARLIIKPSYPEDPAYMQLFRSWGDQNNQVYTAFSTWLDGDFNNFINAIRDYTVKVSEYIDCVHTNWKSQAGTVVSRNKAWVASVGQWLEEIRMLLPDDQKEVALMSWDEWYNELSQWTRNQENWYNSVDSELTTLSKNTETLLNSILSTLQAWMLSMQQWRNSWPTI